MTCPLLRLDQPGLRRRYTTSRWKRADRLIKLQAYLLRTEPGLYVPELVAALPATHRLILSRGPDEDDERDCRVCEALDIECLYIGGEAGAAACLLMDWHREDAFSLTGYLRNLLIYTCAGWDGSA